MTTSPPEIAKERIRVRFWAAAKAAAGVSEEYAAAPATLADLVADVVERHGPDLAKVVSVCSVLVDGRQVGTLPPESVVIRAGSDVEFLPPFAGG